MYINKKDISPLSNLLTYCTPARARRAHMYGTACVRDPPRNRSIGLGVVNPHVPSAYFLDTQRVLPGPAASATPQGTAADQD